MGAPPEPRREPVGASERIPTLSDVVLASGNKAQEALLLSKLRSANDPDLGGRSDSGQSNEVADRLERATQLFSRCGAPVISVERLSPSDTKELIQVMHVQRREFWRILYSIPAVQRERLAEFKRVAAGELQFSSVVFSERGAGVGMKRGETFVRSLLNASERGEESRIPPMLAALPTLPEDAIIRAGKARQELSRLVSLAERIADLSDVERAEVKELRRSQGCSLLRAKALLLSLQDAGARYLALKEYVFLGNAALASRFVQPEGKHEASRDDMLQVAYEGILRAAERFDVSSGNEFSTCASMWIRERLQHHVLSAAHFVQPPPGNGPAFSRLGDGVHLRSESAVQFVRGTAEAYGFSEEKARALAVLARGGLSLDEPNQDGLTFASLVPDRSNDPVVGRILSVERSKILDTALERLDSVHRSVLIGRYGLRDGKIKTRAELAPELGISSSRVGRIEQDAIVKLREILSSRGLGIESLF